MSYSSCSCFVCLTGPYKFVYLVLEQFKCGSLCTILSYWPLDVQHGTPWQRTLRIWELELLLSTKIAEAIRSSVTAWNWVAVGGQGHTEVFQDWFHSEQASQGLIKEVESLCCASGAELGIKKQTHECCQHCFRGCRSGRSACQWSDHTPHTATSQFAWPSSHKEAGSQKTCKQFAEDNLAKSTSYWNHVLWFDESELNLFDSDGVQHVWWRPGEEYQENCALPTVKRGGGSIMVWGCMTTAGAGELRLIEGNMDSNMYCDTEAEDDALPSETVFQHNKHPKHAAEMTLPCCWRWRWLSGQVWLQTWNQLSTCRASSSRWRSTMCLTSSSSVISLWRRGRGCQQQPVQLWWILCPGGLKRCYNNGAPIKYWHDFDMFTHFWCQLFGQ